jgi:hypothetical protein
LDNIIFDIAVSQCNSVFEHVNINKLLPQQQYLLEFEKSIAPSTSITINDVSEIDQSYDFVKLILSTRKMRSLQKLVADLNFLNQYIGKYLYLAVNKFFIVTSQTQYIHGDNYDRKLVNYLEQELTGYTIIYKNYNNNDSGTVGNFIHPITVLIFKVNE